MQAIFHGHVHIHDLVEGRTPRGKSHDIWCICAPAIGAESKHRPSIPKDTTVPRGYLSVSLTNGDGDEPLLTVVRKDVSIGADGKMRFTVGTIDDELDKTLVLRK